MGRKRMDKRRRRPRSARNGDADDDAVVAALSKEERERLSIDAWEPSLLRHMLRAEKKLRES